MWRFGIENRMCPHPQKFATRPFSNAPSKALSYDPGFTKIEVFLIELSQKNRSFGIGPTVVKINCHECSDTFRIYQKVENTFAFRTQMHDGIILASVEHSLAHYVHSGLARIVDFSKRRCVNKFGFLFRTATIGVGGCLDFTAV